MNSDHISPTRPRDDQRVLAVVIGRAGSKGLPGKNALPLLGRPLICHTIDHARAAACVHRTIVSTDGEAIAAAAAAEGVEVVRRPATLAGDHATVDSAVRHAVESVGDEESIIIVLYANVPIRPAGLIDRAVAHLLDTGADSVQSYAPVGKYHPSWMVSLKDGDHVELCDPAAGCRRQDLPPLYIPDGGVIATTRATLFAHEEGHPFALFGKDRRGIENEPGAVVDIDSPHDFVVAEALIRAWQADTSAPKSGTPRIRRAG